MVSYIVMVVLASFGGQGETRLCAFVCLSKPRAWRTMVVVVA